MPIDAVHFPPGNLFVKVDKMGILDETMGLYVAWKGDGQVWIPSEKVLFTEYKPTTYFENIEPLVRMNATAGQMLMDSLWDAGIRPTEGSGSAGAMSAVKYHLEDMRRLVFGR